MSAIAIPRVRRAAETAGTASVGDTGVGSSARAVTPRGTLSSSARTYPGQSRAIGEAPWALIAVTSLFFDIGVYLVVVGLVILVFTGIGWVEAIRSSQRLMYSLNQQPGNLVIRRLVDLGVMIGIFVSPEP